MADSQQQQQLGLVNFTVSLSEEQSNGSYISAEDLSSSVNSTDGNVTFAADFYYGTPGIVALLSILYGIISLIAVIGNALVIVVIVRNRKMHSVTNMFIANLAVADVVIGIFAVPFQYQAALLQRWVLPHFMCSLAPFVQVLSVNISIFTLMVISIDRYRAVIHPLKPRCTKTTAKIVMVVTWIIGIASSLPIAMARKVVFVTEGSETKPFCLDHWPTKWDFDWGKLYRLYLIIVQYFLPLLSIGYTYFRIGYRIWGSKTPGNAEDTRDEMLMKNKRKVSECDIHQCDE